jgi:DNA-binding beta-propeller fold protein YncE
MRANRLSLSLAAAALLAMAPSAAAHGARHYGYGGSGPAGVTEIASGLHNPRHLDVGGDGAVYVAEAGTGGGTASCFDSAEGPACVGATGRVSRIPDADEPNPGARQTLVDGLASFAPASGDDAIGPHGIDVRYSAVYVTNGGPTEPQRNGKTVLRDTLATEDPVADLFGRLLAIGGDGAITRIADIWDFERDNNPDGALGPDGQPIGNPAIDSNAVDVLARHGHFYVADAGGNTILEASESGAIEARHVFPNVPTPGPDGAIVPMQAVPTGVVKGPDGLLYVSQLTGFPFPLGGAKVFVLDPDTGAIVREITGFTNAMDLAFGRDGTLYVLEIDANSLLDPSSEEGAIFAVAPGASTGTRIPLPAGTLTAPGGIAVGYHGELYVTDHGTSGSGGRVLRIGLG